MLLRTMLPEEHLSTDTKDVVMLAVALIGTMAALVLGLLIASAKSTYDTRSNQLLQVSADIILLDRVLAHYGAETKDARATLQRSVVAAMEQFWPADRDRPATIDRRASSVESLYDNIQQLSPQSEAHQYEKCGLVVLVFWLCIIFASFGLFAPRNGTVIAAFFVCALSVSGAIFLILELDRSFEGLLQVSSAPLRAALAQLGQ